MQLSQRKEQEKKGHQHISLLCLPGILPVTAYVSPLIEFNVLTCPSNVLCSDSDKAHLQLAAAKGVLRLARRWDSQIPPDVFHMVVMTVQVLVFHTEYLLLLQNSRRRRAMSIL